MLAAFNARPIVELKSRDKAKIEAILAYGDRLLVGLNTGSLRIYRINEAATADDNETEERNLETTVPKPKQEVAELLREQEKFSRYKIEQLAIVKEANILVSLSNAIVSIHDLQSYELQEQLTKTRGSSAFAVTSNIVKDPNTAVPSIVSRLAVAVKRRLLLWAWHDMELEEETAEIVLPSSIKTLTWATGIKLVAGLSQSYVLVDVDSQKVENIVGPGSIGGAPGQDTSRLGGTMSYIGMGGMIPKPLATRLGGGEMLLAKDVNTHFVDTEKGQPLNRKQIPWATTPETIGYSYPYLLALQEASKGTLEVRNPKTLSLLQSIGLPGANLLQVAQPNISLAHAGKGFLVASDRVIWRMGALGYDDQIDALVESRHLDEAISLLGMLEDALVRDKEGRTREIKMQKAQLLFDSKKFRDSLDLFTEVSAPPERVIRLYPPLIAGDLKTEDVHEPDDEERQDVEATAGDEPNKDTNRRKSSSANDSERKGIVNPAVVALKYQPDDKSDASSIQTLSTSPSKSDKELKAAVRELQAFLADVRRRLQRFFNADNTFKDTIMLHHKEQFNEESEVVIKHLLAIAHDHKVDIKQRLIETATLVDTTLFRAHMYANPSLAGSLFRIANFCDPEVVMQKLEETGRHNEMIDFLFGKKLHREALEKLRKFGEAEEEDEMAPQLHGPERTVAYLQHLPPQMIDLILEYAEWPVRARPELGMEIFLADTENAETQPRDRVLAFLKDIDKGLATRYLEHVIDELNDQNTRLHEELLTLYLEQLAHSDVSESKQRDIQTKFHTLLRSSMHYSPAKLLRRLPQQESPHFYEARAIIYSKMGHHKQALEIYVFKLHDPQKAEDYCNRVYLAPTQAAAVATEKIRPRKVSAPTAVMGTEDSQNSIYHTLLSLYVKPPRGERAVWEPAIELLARHGSRLPAGETLDLIPQSVLVQELEFYFRGRIRGANEVVANGRVEVGLRKVEAVKTQERLLLGDSKEGRIIGGRGRNRRVKVDEERVCGVCFKRLGGSVISVFPE